MDAPHLYSPYLKPEFISNLHIMFFRRLNRSEVVDAHSRPVVQNDPGNYHSNSTLNKCMKIVRRQDLLLSLESPIYEDGPAARYQRRPEGYACNDDDAG